MQAALLISHGSRSEKTKQEVEALVHVLQEKSGIPIFEYAFLELQEPDISQGINRCVERGATKIEVLLNFLNSGRHVCDDIPSILAKSQQDHPHVKLDMSLPVGQHPKIVEIFLDLLTRVPERS